MEEIILAALKEISPCSVEELSDYLLSSLFIYREKIISEVVSLAKIRTVCNKIVEKNPIIFKFGCEGEYKARYGLSKFENYLPQEERFLKIKGYIKRCFSCGMPIYIEDNHIFHFKNQCIQCNEQNLFSLLKINQNWAIISQNYIHAVFDNFQSCRLRLPMKNSHPDFNYKSEFWMINEIARNKKIIDNDRILSLKAEEYIS